MTRFAIDTLQVHGVGMAAAVTLRGVGSAGHRLGRTTAGPNSGNTYDEARFITDVDDEFTFGGVLALKSLLDNVSPLIGKAITDDGTHPGVVLFGQSLDRSGTKGRGAAGTHASITAKKGHVLVNDLGGGKNQLATASVRGINLLKSGESRPTITVYNATLPATFVADEAFKIGPIQVAGTTLGEDVITDMRIELNASIEVIKNLLGYATDALVLKVLPRITISLEDSALLDDAKIDYEGIACAHADTFVSFIGLDPAGGNKSLAGLHHIKCTANGRAYIQEHLSGGGPAVAGSTIVIETTETSGGVAPLVFTTGVALA